GILQQLPGAVRVELVVAGAVLVPGVLTGLPRTDRWPELREHALAEVLRACRSTAGWVVVDIGFCLEADEELSFDTRAPRRNGATLAVLAEADHVVAVGAADPVGVQRLVRGLDDLSQATQAPRTVVLNRVRPGSVGRDPERRLHRAMARLAGVEDALLVPEDRAGCDAALLTGRTLREERPHSPARVAVVELARRVGAPVRRHRRGAPAI
ncbi:MinD/ParA family ATP-binding protein, partial [Ornithinicoccus halotolerans]|uniref:MinD/ParA family ATP-binding protein n=1 Tax=Ornithinicoccus halotolerans TaxID=1748220 RepID=UPI0038996190